MNVTLPVGDCPATVAVNVTLWLKVLGFCEEPRAVLLVAGAWEGAQVRLRVTSQAWAGVGRGNGRLRGRRVRVMADGRGE